MTITEPDIADLDSSNHLERPETAAVSRSTTADGDVNKVVLESSQEREGNGSAKMDADQELIHDPFTSKSKKSTKKSVRNRVAIFEDTM